MSRLLPVLFLLGGCTAGVFAAADEWRIEPPPQGWRNSARQFPEELFFELPQSKTPAAIFGPLSQAASSRLDENAFSYYAGRHFLCPKNYTPYLVRAPFGHGGTGAFSVYLSGKDVVVAHESLGKTSVVTRSALIVCLASAPDRVFNLVVIDE